MTIFMMIFKSYLDATIPWLIQRPELFVELEVRATEPQTSFNILQPQSFRISQKHQNLCTRQNIWSHECYIYNWPANRQGYGMVLFCIIKVWHLSLIAGSYHLGDRGRGRNTLDLILMYDNEAVPLPFLILYSPSLSKVSVHKYKGLEWGLGFAMSMYSHLHPRQLTFIFVKPILFMWF